MKNLVLIGMPGSGKTTVGAALSNLLGMPLVDTDALVEAAAGKSIPALFAQEGEPYFRDLESAAAARAAAMDGVIVATGGGMILREANMNILGRDGLIVFLDRPPEDIAAENHSGRPLVGDDRDRIFKLYDARIHLYRRYAHHRVGEGETAAEVAGTVAALWRKAGGKP